MFTRILLSAKKTMFVSRRSRIYHLSKNSHSLESDCVGVKPCSKIFSPVCASAEASNITFSNECQMKQEVCTKRTILKVSQLQRP